MFAGLHAGHQRLWRLLTLVVAFSIVTPLAAASKVEVSSTEAYIQALNSSSVTHIVLHHNSSAWNVSDQNMPPGLVWLVDREVLVEGDLSAGRGEVYVDANQKMDRITITGKGGLIHFKNLFVDDCVMTETPSLCYIRVREHARVLMDNMTFGDAHCEALSDSLGLSKFIPPWVARAYPGGESTPARREFTITDSGWIMGYPDSYTWRMRNVTLMCTAGLTHPPLAPGAKVARSPWLMGLVVIELSRVGAKVIITAALLIVAIVIQRSWQSDASSKLQPSIGWEISASAIEICRKPDGSEWLLGEGRFGRVFRAIKDGVQVVAVKRLNCSDARFRAAFEREMGMLQFVSRDSHIVQFLGAVFESDSSALLVSEFMQGGDLRGALSSGHKFQWYRRGKDTMLDIVRAATFLHANNVVHRDISAKNVLLSRQRAKLADVGLARLMDGRPSSTAGLPKAVGTLPYAAPEMLSGEQCTEAADVWSLGVVLWEIVTQEVPLRGQLRPPRVPEECPQEVADAMRACLKRDPAERPTARELYCLLSACPPFGPEGELSRRGSSSQGSSAQGSLHSRGSAGSKAAGAEGALQPGPSGDAGLRDLLNDFPTGCHTSLDLPSKSEGEAHRQLSAELAMVTIDIQNVTICKDGGTTPIVLGTGSFGTVYKGLLDGILPLAVKKLALGANPAAHTAFLRECGLLWRLRHPSICSLVGAAVSEGEGYLLLEYLENGSLFRMLNAKVKGSQERLFAWGRRGQHVALQVATALLYLHSLRIMHFDLKSGNVLLDRQLNAKIADVGLARVTAQSHLTISDCPDTGTLAYMAPELIAGGSCTPSIDIYSFGVLLLELCTGAHPELRRSADLQVPRDCPGEVADLIFQCTAQQPSERPTARELVERLSALVVSPSQAKRAEKPKSAAGAADTSPADAGATLQQPQPSTWLPAVQVSDSPPMASPFGSAEIQQAGMQPSPPMSFEDADAIARLDSAGS